MKLHRFIGNFDLTDPRLRISDSEIVGQMRKVLRLKPGDLVILGDGKSKEALSRIIGFQSETVEVEISEVSENQNEPSVHAVLYCSLLKRENFELVVQKSTEVGIKEIVPIISQRTVKRDMKQERLAKIIKEAAEQSGRGVLPILHDPIPFQAALENSGENDFNLFLHPESSEHPPDRMKPETQKRVGIFIGPEGGWDGEEIQAARDKNFQIVSLGKLTLRSETAAIVASYLLASR